MNIKINVYSIDVAIDKESKELKDDFLGSLSLLNTEKEKYKYLSNILYRDKFSSCFIPTNVKNI